MIHAARPAFAKTGGRWRQPPCRTRAKHEPVFRLVDESNDDDDGGEGRFGRGRVAGGGATKRRAATEGTTEKGTAPREPSCSTRARTAGRRSRTIVTRRSWPELYQTTRRRTRKRKKRVPDCDAVARRSALTNATRGGSSPDPVAIWKDVLHRELTNFPRRRERDERTFGEIWMMPTMPPRGCIATDEKTSDGSEREDEHEANADGSASRGSIRIREKVDVLIKFTP